MAEKHGGAGTAANLAWSCFRCNSHKGPNLAGIDPESSTMTRLFNPRLDTWSDHFRWAGPRLVGKTAVGRTTLEVLCINRPDVVLLRRELLAEGVKF